MFTIRINPPSVQVLEPTFSTLPTKTCSCLEPWRRRILGSSCRRISEHTLTTCATSTRTYARSTTPYRTCCGRRGTLLCTGGYRQGEARRVMLSNFVFIEHFEKTLKNLKYIYFWIDKNTFDIQLAYFCSHKCLWNFVFKTWSLSFNSKFNFVKLGLYNENIAIIRHF